MRNIFSDRFILLSVILMMLSACTTTVEISHTKTVKIDVMSDAFRMVKSQDTSDPLQQAFGDSQGEFFLIELKSMVDIANIIHKKEMAFLYYVLRSCGGDPKLPDIYSAPVYIDTQATPILENGFYYYAAVPHDYTDKIDQYLEMQGKEMADMPDDICIALGAGNMAGQHLSTNSVRIELN